MSSQREKVEAFRRLHAEGCFVIPNPWDASTAVALEQMGFKALATTSAGHAWSLARPDNGVRRDEALEHLRQIADAVDVPVNADFEHGFARDPHGVAVNVKLAAATGIAGLSIEDSTGDPGEPLYPFDLAVERVRAARQAIDESGTGVVLTGRSEGFVVGRPDLEETIRRPQAYAEAGADCLYAPGDGGAVGRRRRRRAQPREPASANAPFITVGKQPTSVCGGSASAARWRGPPGPASSGLHRRSPQRARFRDSSTCRMSTRSLAVSGVPSTHGLSGRGPRA
jgi:hypothetical protein